MRNIEVRIHVKLEVKVPIEIFLRNLPLPPPSLTQKFRLPQKILTNVKKMDPCKKILTQANHLKIMIHAKNIWTHVKILPTQPTHPRNPPYHKTHAI